MKSIFVSSTFKDMQEERDILNKSIVPEINEKIKNINQEISITDLRWGVNTEDLDNEEGSKKVLEVCFDEIERCKPYMIIFIGNRYGWIPSIETLKKSVEKYDIQITEPVSVTELEIQFGALNRENLDNVIFCFRNDDVQAEENQTKIDALKQKILNKNPKNIIYYTKKIKDGKTIFSENFRTEIIQTICDKIKEESKNDVIQYWQQREIESVELLIEKRNKVFIGRQDIIKEYLDDVKKGNDYLYIVQGKKGTGKTSIVAKMYSELKKEENVCVFPFICCNNNKSSHISDLQKQIIFFLEKNLGCEYQKNDSKGIIQLRDEIEDLMKKFTIKYPNRRVILLIDGYNLIEPDINVKEKNDYNWFLPANNLTVFITISETMCLPQTHIYSYKKLPNIDKSNIKEIIIKTCGINRKELSNRVVDKIMSRKSIDNLLYLDLLIQRLMMIDIDDLKCANTMEDISNIQIEIINEIPDDVETMTRYILESACKHLGKSNVKEALNLMALSSRDLSRKEIISILTKNCINITMLDLAEVVRYMKNCFIERNDGELAFSNTVYKESLKNLMSDTTKYYNYIYKYIKEKGTQEFKIKHFTDCCLNLGKIDELFKFYYELYKDNNENELFIQYAHLIERIELYTDEDKKDDFYEKWNKIIKSIFKIEDERFIRDILFEKFLRINPQYMISVYEILADLINGGDRNVVLCIAMLRAAVGNVESSKLNNIRMRINMYTELPDVRLDLDLMLKLARVSTEIAVYLADIKKFASSRDWLSYATTQIERAYYNYPEQEHLILEEEIYYYNNLMTLINKIENKRGFIEIYSYYLKAFRKLNRKYANKFTKEKLKMIKYSKKMADVKLAEYYFESGKKSLSNRILKKSINEIEKLEKLKNSEMISIWYYEALALQVRENLNNKYKIKNFIKKFDDKFLINIIKYPQNYRSFCNIKKDLYDSEEFIINNNSGFCMEEVKFLEDSIYIMKKKLEDNNLKSWQNILALEYIEKIGLKKNYSNNIKEYIVDLDNIINVYLNFYEDIEDFYYALEKNYQIADILYDNDFWYRAYIRYKICALASKEAQFDDERFQEMEAHAIARMGEVLEKKNKSKFALNYYIKIYKSMGRRKVTQDFFNYEILEKKIIPLLKKFEKNDDLCIYIRAAMTYRKLYGRLNKKNKDEEYNRLDNMFEELSGHKFEFKNDQCHIR